MQNYYKKTKHMQKINLICNKISFFDILHFKAPNFIFKVNSDNRINGCRIGFLL